VKPKTWLQCYWIALAVLLSGCNKAPVSVAKTDNANIEVERLFEHDGCVVYRFRDDGERYFVKCASGEDRAEWKHVYSCGKTTCVRDEAITTNEVSP